MIGLLEKFGIKKSHIFEVVDIVKIEDIKENQILEFRNGYHTKTPYYAEVIEVGEGYFKTSIPDYHVTKISIGNNWDYHKIRIRVVGQYRDFKHLLFNQKNLVTHTRP